MSETDHHIEDDQDTQFETSKGRGTDDRRQTVNPVDHPVPTSPEPEEDSVRKGQEKLERVKPY